MNVDIKTIASTLTGNRKASADVFLKAEAQARDNALNWLKAKFPEIDEQVFFTDYTGKVHADVVEFRAVVKAAEAEALCAECKGSCSLPEALKSGRPVVKIAESPRGFKYLDVSWTAGTTCRFQLISDGMLRKSGLRSSYQHMTFKNYEAVKKFPEVCVAMREAMKASKEQSNLILAGKPGTGKTHLAVAIALRAMEQGRQAVFRLVSAMLDEIQSAINGKGDYDGIMGLFKTVPCLVLDDLGHENMTAARASYLHQIIDWRYGEGSQTIVTTNARTPNELGEICGREFIEPVISRLMAHGSWVTIEHADDRRLRNAG